MERQRVLHPELEVGSPQDLFRVDSARRRIGQTLSGLGQKAEDLFVRTAVELYEAPITLARGLRTYPERLGTPTGIGMLFPQAHLVKTALTPLAGEGEGPRGALFAEATRPINYLPAGAGVSALRAGAAGVGSALLGRGAQSYVTERTGSEIAGTVAGLAGSLAGGGGILAATSPAGRAAGKRFLVEESGEIKLPENWDESLSAVRKALRGAGFTANQARNVANEIDRTKSATTPMIGSRTREMLEKAGLKQFADEFADTTAVVRRSRGAAPPPSLPPSVAATASTEELARPGGWWRSVRGAEPFDWGNTSTGMSAAQIRAARKARDEAARAAEELTRPDGWWRSRRGAEPVDLGNTSTGMSTAEIRAARKRRQDLDGVIKAAGKTPAPVGLGKVAQVVGETLRASQRLMLGGEFSAATRQMGRLAPAHPLVYAQAVGSGWKAIRNDETFKVVDQGMKSTLAGRLFEQAGGRLRSIDDPADLRDIAISDWPSKIPFLGRLYDITERGSFAAMNAQQIGVFRSWLKANWDTVAPNVGTFEHAEQVGNVPLAALDQKLVQDMVNYLQVAGGRAPLLEKHDAIRRFLPVANAAFLAPQWRISRGLLAAADVSSLARMSVGQSTPVSKEIAKNAVAYYATGMAIMAGAVGVAGAKVGTNPLSSNFGRIEIGPVSYDIWGGQAQMARTFAQMARGQSVSRSGTERDINQLKPLWDWLRGGLGPGPGLLADYSAETTLSGQKFNWKDAAIQRMTAIIAQDVQEALNAEMGVDMTFSGGAKGLLQSVPAAFVGVGINRTTSGVQQALDKEVGGDFSKASFDDQQAALDRRPDLAKALEKERAAVGGVIGNTEDIRADYSKRQAALDAERESGAQDDAGWYEASKKLQREQNVLIAYEFQKSGSKAMSREAQPGDTPREWYLRVIAANTNPESKTVDWDAVEKWRASLNPEQDRYIDDHVNTRPLTKESADIARFDRELRQSGYWEIKDEAWAGMKHPIAQQYETYADYAKAVRTRTMARFADSVPNTIKLKAADSALSSDPLAEAYRERANRIEMPWVVKNPKLADQAYTYGIWTPTKDQVRMIAHKMGRSVEKVGD